MLKIIHFVCVFQLLHISSNKYVTVSIVQTSKTEYANMQVFYDAYVATLLYSMNYFYHR